jgi:ATP-dependent 26S proteasome regulatory subunit
MKSVTLLTQIEDISKVIISEATASRFSNCEQVDNTVQAYVLSPDASSSDKQGAETYSQAYLLKQLHTLQKRFHRNAEMVRYKLTTSDLKVIAYMYRQANEQLTTNVSAKEILEICCLIGTGLKDKMDFLISLLDREILSLSLSKDGDYHCEIEMIIEGRYALNGFFLSCLFEKDVFSCAKSYLDQQLINLENTMDVVVEYLNILCSNYPELLSTVTNNNGHYYGLIVNEFLHELWIWVQSLPEKNLFVNTLKHRSITEFDFKCLIMVYYLTVHNEQMLDERTLIRLLSSNAETYTEYISLLQHESSDKQNNFLDISSPFGSTKYVILNQSLLDELSKASEIKVANHLQDYLEHDNMFEEIHTVQNLEQIILPKHDYDLLSSIIMRLANNEITDLSKWGLITPSLSSDTDTDKACNILIYGHPGTGKTLAAGVIANELKRPLLAINANNLRNCYYGETEKKVRKLFRLMRKIILNVKPAPVFLINEADQLLHTRILAQSSVDFTENGIQNIFLEEMEIFPGTLIVTTNLIENMDSAISRRFHFKLEFTFPDEECRKQLWRLHLPFSIPGAKEIDVTVLSKTYNVTGGQIRLIVQNACSQSILRGKNSRLFLQDIVQYADLEVSSSFEHLQKVVGFKNE